MARCYKCGNDYDKYFEVIFNGTSYKFDSFECAISELAPKCKNCGCQVIGHGVEMNDSIYCYANCAYIDGKTALVDRVY